MTFLFGLIIGLSAGCIVGMIIMGLCLAARCGDCMSEAIEPTEIITRRRNSGNESGN